MVTLLFLLCSKLPSQFWGGFFCFFGILITFVIIIINITTTTIIIVDVVVVIIIIIINLSINTIIPVDYGLRCFIFLHHIKASGKRSSLNSLMEATVTFLLKLSRRYQRS